MEHAEATMTSEVEYHWMRAQIQDAITALSDQDYQQRVWIEHIMPSPTFWDSLDDNIHLLFDDSRVLDNPQKWVGLLIFPDELAPLQSLKDLLGGMINRLGDLPDLMYLEDPEWAEVVSLARGIVPIMAANDSPSSPVTSRSS